MYQFINSRNNEENIMSLINVNNTSNKYLFLEEKIDLILKYFSNKNIFRYSPKLKTDIIVKIRNQLILNKKISFLSYWGIGIKKDIDDIDISAIKFQKKWMDEFSNILGLEYEVSYIISDTHADINSIPHYITNDYIQSVENFLLSYGFKVIKSSTLLAKYNIHLTESINNYNIENIVQNSSYKSMIKGLRKQAKSHSYVADNKSYLLYFKANLIENSVICEEYPKHIFLTYKPPQEKIFLPSLAKIHTFVDVNQQVKRPWFNNGNEV